MQRLPSERLQRDYGPSPFHDREHNVLPDFTVRDLPQRERERLDRGVVPTQQLHAVFNQSWQRKRRLRYVPHQCQRLLGIPVHGLSWQQQREQL